MNKVWVLDLDTLEIFYEVTNEITKEVGRPLNINEREQIFLAVMKEKNIKPAGQNELTKTEFIKELTDNGKKILNIDEKGFTFIEKRRNKIWEINF